MCLEIKKVRYLSEKTGCPFSECTRAINLCGDINAAYFFLKLTNQAVVRYKITESGSEKWILQDYIDNAKELSKKNLCS